MDPLAVGVIHWVHVFLGIFWFGTILYTRVVLFPLLKTVPAEHVKAVRAAMVSAPAARRWTYVFSYGTVVMGIIRGAVVGVFAELGTPYGLTYLAALAVGVLMLAFNFSPWFRAAVYRQLYVAGFPVMFTLMVLMRFDL
jgi:hypothetical protein